MMKIYIAGLTALDLFTVVAQKHEAMPRIPTCTRVRVTASVLFSCIYPFRYFARSPESRAQPRAEPIRRFDNRSILFVLSVQEQEELGAWLCEYEARLQGPLLQEIACGTTHLQRANVTYTA